ncbi:MAG: GxxExxY protein [Desulfobulbaceae bacterium]|nr:GxxExxY protein [Desulfobulbaceae bacterium]
MPQKTQKNTETDFIDKELSYKVRGCVFEVYRQLGNGFLESVYEKALMHELSLQGLQAERQIKIPVVYKNVSVGTFSPDIIVENKIILELKAQANLNIPICKAQLLNYLKASDMKIGLLINFTYPKAIIERFIL